MAINKNKVMEGALKLAEKRAYDKAIKEFLRIVQEDPKDVRVWLKIGDLYAKKGAKSEATETYLRVANLYSEQGFFLKAVAVYKQVLKLDSHLVEVHFRLAGMYRQLQLPADAIAQYEHVATFSLQESKSDVALRALTEILEIDSNNVATRIKLAELHSKDGNTTEAITEFTRVADQLRQQGRTDDFIKVAERLVWHQPDNRQLNRELAQLYVKRGDQRRALQKLHACFKADPRDVETLHLLAGAFEELDQKAKAVSVLRELARIFQENGQQDKRIDVLRRISAFNPDDTEVRAVFGTGQQPAAQVGNVFGTGQIPAAAGGKIPSQSDAALTGANPIVKVNEPITGRVGRVNEPITGRMGAANRERSVPNPISAPFGSAEKPLGSKITGNWGRAPTGASVTQPVNAASPSTSQTPSAQSSGPQIAFKTAGSSAVPQSDNPAFRPIRPPAPPGGRKAPGETSEGMFAATRTSAVAPTAPAGEPNEEFHEAAAKTLAETDVYVKYGLHQKAIDHVRPILARDPSHTAAREKLKELYIQIGRYEEAANELVLLVEQLGPSQPDLAGSYLSELGAVSPGDPRAEVLARRFSLHADQQAMRLDARGSEPSPLGELPGPEPDEFASEFSTGFDQPPGENAANSENAIDEIVIGDDSDIQQLPAETHSSPDFVQPPTASLYPARARAEARAPSTAPSAQIIPPLDLDPDDAPVQRRSAPLDLAEPTASPSQRPSTDLIDLSWANPPSVQPSPSEANIDPPTRQVVIDSQGARGRDREVALHDRSSDTAPFTDGPITAHPSSTSLEDDLDEVDFWIQQNLYSEAKAILESLIARYPKNPLILSKLQDVEAVLNVAYIAPPTVAPSLHSIHLPIGQEMGQTDAALLSLDAPKARASEHAITLTAAMPHSEVYQLSDPPVVASDLGEADVETHYDLGIAYKEMGLFEDAIKEFQLVRVVPERAVECALMIGLCLSELGRLPEAVTLYRSALHEPHVHERELLALHYELGFAYERLSDATEAAYFFDKVVRRDPHFRDAGRRLASLRDR